MFEVYVTIVGMINALIMLVFVGTLMVQYHATKHGNYDRSYMAFRIQTVLIVVFHLISFTVLMNSFGFSKEILLIYLGNLALILVVNMVVDHLFSRTLLPLWSISQFLLVIGFVILARLDQDLGVRQLYIASAAYLLTFVVTWVFSKIKIVHYLGIPSIVLAYGLLLMTNDTIGGANNWLKIGSFSFQPSEIVKVLYILFLAAILSQYKKYERNALVVAGLLTSGLIFIQVFQNDLGSALIYYVVFVLMCYVYTTNRYYIIGGFLATMAGGIVAYYKFAHVKTRVEAWIDPLAEELIDNKGYQIAQSLFALGNGGLFGSGLTLGQPDKIPVVTTDFIYSAIFEEFGLIVGIGLIVLILYFLLFGMLMIENSPFEFDFLLGSGILMVLAFQSFLIIGGVTKMVPLTGVTLPFVSYGGSSLMTSFIMLGILQGIAIDNQKKTVTQREKHGEEKPKKTRKKKQTT